MEADREERSPMLGTAKRSKSMTAICIGLLAVGVTCVVVGGVMYSKAGHKTSDANSDSVGVVVDAGGSGTRLIVYSYRDNGQLRQLKYIKCEREGLAKYSQPQFPHLRTLLKNCFYQGVQSLPAGKKVPIYFAATAGMRLLKLRNPVMYGKIWNVVKDCIEASEFKLMSSRTITGFEEAKWGWIAANYLKHSLNTDHTSGTIDFGSSSVQLTFQHDNKKGSPEEVQTLLIDGHNTTIYGHSYLCYGIVEMLRRFNAKVVKDSGYQAEVENPCYGKGYTKPMTSSYLWASPCSSGEYAREILGEEINGPADTTFVIKGSGDFNQCHSQLKKLLDRRCRKPSCGLNNVFQPEFNNKNIDFLALSTFYYIGKALHIRLSSNRDDYRQATQRVCEKTYDVKTAGPFGHLTCFQASYGYYLLTSFGFPKDWNIEFIKKIDGKKIGWPLGLMYMKKGEMFERVVKYTVSLTYRPEFIGLAVFGIVAVIGAAIFFYVYRRRSSQDQIA